MKKILKVPPSKSLSHRALICAAMAKGTSEIKNLLLSEDTKRTMECLKCLRANFEQIEEGRWKVEGIDQKSLSFDSALEINVGESGTTCRLITPIISVLKGIRARIYGKGRMHRRPIKELAQCLEKMGVSFTWVKEEGFPPFILYSNGLKGGNVDISLENSSQYLSGLLLASPMAHARTEISITGKKAVSWPYVGLTLQTMKSFGIGVEVLIRENSKWNKEKMIIVLASEDRAGQEATDNAQKIYEKYKNIDPYYYDIPISKIEENFPEVKVP